MIENLDWNVGRVVAALTDTGLLDDTAIIFFSDHGDMHGSQGQFRKTNPYQESIRIPFIIGGMIPKYETGSGRPKCPVNHVDIAPTTLGLCGLTPPEWMCGHDYSGHAVPRQRRSNCQPRAVDPDSAFIQSVIPTGHGDSTDRPWRGIVTDDGWKYVCLEGQPWLLFNLNEDRYEQANLAHNSAFRTKRRELQERLAKWIAETGDEFPLPELP